MTIETRRSFVVTALTAIVLAVIGGSVGAQQPGREYQAPRAPGGKPSLEGIWQVRNTANDDLQDHAGSLGIAAGLGVIVDPADGSIPYRPEALAKREQNRARRETDDPVAKCYIAGVPRTMYLPHPLQIFQTPEEVVILSEFVHTTRWVPVVPLARIDGYESWIGDSRGRWEGDTLVIETVGFNDSTWFDHSGDYHSDRLKVTERLRRISDDALSYEAVIDDSQVFTRPWTIRMPLYLHKDRDRLLENECHLYAEDAHESIVGTHPEVKP